jgi:hypothetical protein
MGAGVGVFERARLALSDSKRVLIRNVQVELALEEGKVLRLLSSTAGVIHQAKHRRLHHRWADDVLAVDVPAALRGPAAKWRDEDALGNLGQLLADAPAALIVAKDPQVVGAALLVKVRPRLANVLVRLAVRAHARRQQVTEAPIHLPHGRRVPHGDEEVVGELRVVDAIV